MLEAPKQIGIAKRRNNTLMDVMRNMISKTKLPKVLGEAFNSYVHL